jgi:hypothetical protein
MLMVGAGWFLWELWGAVEPKPITDDFLKLLNDSFARNWRDPRTWPWSRVLWAYGFTFLGAVLTATAFWMTLSSHVTRVPSAKVETSHTFRLGS